VRRKQTKAQEYVELRRKWGYLLLLSRAPRIRHGWHRETKSRLTRMEENAEDRRVLGNDWSDQVGTEVERWDHLSLSAPSPVDKFRVEEIRDEETNRHGLLCTEGPISDADGDGLTRGQDREVIRSNPIRVSQLSRVN